MSITVFHGSDSEVKNPSLLNARLYTDFGKGFYVTESFKLAEKWAIDRPTSVITQYEFDTDNLNVLNLEFNEEWLDFVIANRNVATFPLGYEAVSGKAIDSVSFAVVEWYEEGFVSAELALKALSVINLETQICLKNEVAIKRLRFVKSHIMSAERKKELNDLCKAELSEKDSAAKAIIVEANKASRLPNT